MLPIRAVMTVASVVFAVTVSIAALLAPHHAMAGAAAVAEAQRAAYSADFGTGIMRLKAMSAADANDVEAVFATGTLQVLDAFARLQESLFRHAGAPTKGRNSPRAPMSGMMPFGWSMSGPALVPYNPRALPMTYRELRRILARFVDDLAVAEAELALVGERQVKLPLQPFRIALDLDHDGAIAPGERLFVALLGGMGAGMPMRESDIFLVFDTADASWLRGYCNLLMAMTNLLLAADFEQSYEASGHTLYGLAATEFGRELLRQSKEGRPRARIESEIAAIEKDLAALGPRVEVDQSQIQAIRDRLRQLPRTPEAAIQRRQLNDELANLYRPQREHHAKRTALGRDLQRLQSELAGELPGSDYAWMMDLVASIHTMNWRIVEPTRLRAVGSQLLKVFELNRVTWRLARAETDDDHEWLPNSRQTPPLGARPLTDSVIDGWLATTALAEQVLKGEKLLPHPRFRKGVNLKKLLDTAAHIDIVMMAAGHGLTPYLEEGDIVDEKAWAAITRPLQNNLMMYSLWFN